jgi:outer membrane protein insertion porin family
LEDRVRAHRPGRARRGPRLARIAAVAIGLAAAGALAEPANPESTADAARGSAPRIAVFGFSVQSADADPALGGRLARELAAILAEDKRVAVVDEAVRRELPEPGAGETRDAALRRVGAELAADYLVTGRATQLVRGGGIDLAVRLTRRDPGATSDTQVVTGHSVEELTQRLSEVAERIVGQVVGTPPARVVAVEITGAPGFEDQLARRLSMHAGDPYDPLAVRADLATLRSSAAVISAQAHTERTPAGVVVRYDVVLADPNARRRGAGEPIAQIVVRGNKRIDAEAIRGRIGSKAGAPLDPAQVAKDIDEIHKLGFFRDVKASRELTDAGAAVVFEVEENPLVRQISIAGNENIDSDKIREALTLATGSTLDYPLLFENRRRIEGLYRAQGYYLAKVKFEIEPLGESAVGIHFDVNEGQKQKLRKIEFTGNEHFDDAKLTEGFQTRTWHFWSLATSWFDNSGTYSEPLFVQDLRKVERKYGDAGYLQLHVGEPEVVPQEDGLIVRVPIQEGKQFHVGKINVTGDSTVDIDALRNKLKLKTGDVFNRTHLNDDIAALTAHYQDRGFYFAQVTPLSNLSQATEQVDVAFDVRKGPLYFIRRIDLGGNSVTIDPVVRREIPIAEGQLYSQRKVQFARQRVERLGYFESVDFQIEPTDAPDQLDLKVAVVERPTGSFSFGAGYSSQDGVIVTGSLAQANLFGRGYAANLSVDYGSRSQRFFINLADPYFLGSTYSLSTTLSRTSLLYPGASSSQDFKQTQTGADIVLGHALDEEGTTRGFLRYGFDVRKLQQSSAVNAAAPILREILQNNVTTSLVGVSAVSDTRDDRLAPTAGHQIGGSLEGAGLGGFSRFARMEGRATYYLGAPSWLFARSTFVVAVRAGWAVPFNVISDFSTFSPLASDVALLAVSPQFRRLEDIDSDLKLPLTDRYFLGGLGQFQLRGFKARSVGPRRPVLRQIGGNVFAPVGIDPATGQCDNGPNGLQFGGDGSGRCNRITDKDIRDFADLHSTNVVGGNKFSSATVEYRFPISETIGLQGVAFIDMGNAFDERQWNLFDVTEWRYGTGAGVQWFSPFGPLAVVLGFPLDKLSVEKSPVFEFSIGGSAF